MTTCVEAKSITKSYNGRQIIKDVSVTLHEGEIVGLLGVSGAGKTTLFNIIAGLEQPDGGAVLLRGEDVTGKPGQISYMLQKDLLLPYKKIIDNVCLPLRVRGVRKAAARAEVAPYFAQFGLEGTQMQYPSQLSGGMRQRAALLRTYISATGGVALLDEPFSALDTLTKSAMHAWYLDVMAKIKLSTLFVTHDIDEAILLSDRIYILAGAPGAICAEIEITEKKPRDGGFALTDAFLNYKRKITQYIK